MRAAFREGLGCVVLAPDQGLEDVSGLPELRMPPPPGDPSELPWPDGDAVREKALEPAVRIEELLHVPPVRLHTVPGFTTEVFSFATDLPLLDRWGTPMLFGPGSILVAHTPHEHIALDELGAAVGSYERLVRALL